MGESSIFRGQERARAAGWKAKSPTLPVEARRAAPYVRDGRPQGPDLPFCLPAEHAALNLLPEVRELALGLFAELGIPWHQGYAGGPSNHLLSSQVQCVNALGQMVRDPSRIIDAFGGPLGTAEVLEIEPGRFLTFEYIGDDDVFGEAPGRPRTRGSMCTSIDAAFVHRTRDGVIELVLVEWKYTESYDPRHEAASQDATRWQRYGAALTAPDGPVRADVLDFDHLLDEPLYQLVRQQLLAHELEKVGAHGAERVRVVHVCLPANDAYQASLTRPDHLAVGATTSEVWSALLRRPDRFVSLDPAVLLDPEITSAEYCARYGPTEDGPPQRLRARLVADPDADVASLRTDTDRRLSIGQDVWRLRWRNQHTTAVAGDADLTTTCGAAIDALALLEDYRRTEEDGRGTVDHAGVNVLVDRPLSGGSPTEVDQALRSVRDAATGEVPVHLWYACPDGGWVEDVAPAPTWRRGDRKVTGWLTDLLIPRLTAKPPALALDIVEAVGDPSLQLYPTTINRSSHGLWALRIDGLQIGTATATHATLTVGQARASGDGSQRRSFTKVFGAPSVTVTADPGTGEHGVDQAAERIGALLRTFREVDVPGAPVTHRSRKGRAIVDEHNLEARLLKGIVSLNGNREHQLVANDELVARGSQFPTLWGHGGRARYLDAMLRRGTTPVAVELKVATGGRGRYYRRALTQAVLYRHFIHNAPDLDPWFATAGLDRASTVAAIALPAPERRTNRWERDLELLQSVAGHLAIDVHVVDDRRSPDWYARTGVPEPAAAQREHLTWTLAAALQRRWPITLGWTIETQSTGDSHDTIGLRSLDDRTLGWDSHRPWILMNRQGAICTYSTLGTETWAWRDAWAALAASGDSDKAALTLGTIAGLGDDETGRTIAFPAMAAELLRITNEPGTRWRTPEFPGDERPLSTRWTVELRTGAVTIDQRDLRTWTRTSTSVTEVHASDPISRLHRALKLLGYQPTP